MPAVAKTVEDEGWATEEEDEDQDVYEVVRPQWVSLVVTLGVALVAVFAAQLVAALVQGFMIRGGESMEPTGVATDLIDRLGYPFGSLGPAMLLYLVGALGLLCLPGLVGVETSRLQSRLIGITLVGIVLMALVMMVGSVLAVRYSIHEYTARDATVPPFIRVQFTSFLLGCLGGAAIALFGSLAALSVRRRARAMAGPPDEGDDEPLS